MISKYKYILFDVDGTLFNAEREYNNDLFDKLSELRQRGVKVSLATARNKYFVKKILADLNITNPVIIESGLVIFDPKKDSFVSYQEIKIATANAILDCLRNISGYRVGVSTNNGFRVNQKYYSELSKYIGTSELELIEPSLERDIVFSIWIRDIDKRTFERIQRLAAECNLFALGEGKGEKHSIFVYNSKAEKMYGLNVWLEYCNVNPKEVIYFGNSDGDIDISVACGLGCAVSNASEKLKSVSKLVASRRYSDGILEILNLIF